MDSTQTVFWQVLRELGVCYDVHGCLKHTIEYVTTSDDNLSVCIYTSVVTIVQFQQSIAIPVKLHNSLLIPTPQHIQICY